MRISPYSAVERHILLRPFRPVPLGIKVVHNIECLINAAVVDIDIGNEVGANLHSNMPVQNVQNTFILPTVEPLFAASLSAVPLQLFAYYVALAKQLDIDKPRNLAKSVTVE